MNKYVSARKIDQTMAFILDHPHMSDDELNSYASDPENKHALAALRALKAINYRTAFGGSRLYDLSVLDEGILYFYRKHEQRIGFIKGFIVGILTPVIASLLSSVVTWLF